MAVTKSARLGVVLSTGNLRGVFAHVGFLLALEKLGISYHALAGSSAGALISAVVASGRTPREALEWLMDSCLTEYWKKDSFLKILYWLLIRRGRSYTGFISTDLMEKTLRDMLRVRTFEECPTPLYIVAANITKGVKEIFHSGEIAPAAVASAPIPILFKARRIGEDYYVDVGVFELTPRTAVCCREGLDALIVNQIVMSREHSLLDNSFLQE
jgi:NTE family protein